jgi:hypothetical protein
MFNLKARRVLCEKRSKSQITIRSKMLTSSDPFNFEQQSLREYIWQYPGARRIPLSMREKMRKHATTTTVINDELTWEDMIVSDENGVELVKAEPITHWTRSNRGRTSTAVKRGRQAIVYDDVGTETVNVNGEDVDNEDDDDEDDQLFQQEWTMDSKN